MSSLNFNSRCSALIWELRQETPSKTPSLIATVFGDIVETYGGEIWLGSLTRLLLPLGISERLVRTAVYRLSRDGSLLGDRVGRRSYYRLSSTALLRVKRFDRRIYYFNEPVWDGNWRLVFAGTKGVNSVQRAELRKRMEWLGFGIVAPNVYAHPTTAMEPVWQLMEELGISDKVTIMRAANYDQTHGLGTLEMVRQCFDIEGLEQAYNRFIKRYQPLATTADNSGMDPEHCLVLRIMLIHQYRRILLHDPELPAPLLPENWKGYQAHRLCAQIYKAVEECSNEQILAIAENRDGAFGAMVPEHSRRFAPIGQIDSR